MGDWPGKNTRLVEKQLSTMLLLFSRDVFLLCTASQLEVNNFQEYAF